MYKFLGPRSQEFSSGAEKMCVCVRESGGRWEEWGNGEFKEGGETHNGG